MNLCLQTSSFGLLLGGLLLGSCSGPTPDPRIAVLEERVERLTEQVTSLGAAQPDEIETTEDYAAIQSRHVHVPVHIQSLGCSLPDAYASRVLVQQTGFGTCNVRSLRLLPNREDVTCPSDFDIVLNYFGSDHPSSRVEVRGAEEVNGALISTGGPQFQCPEVEQVSEVWIVPPGFDPAADK